MSNSRLVGVASDASFNSTSRQGLSMAFKALLIVPAIVMLSACASTANYTKPAETNSPDYDRTVDASFDKTWNALIDYASSNFFSIDNFEKDSGLMTLSFGSSDPDTYIDCGQWNAQWTNPQTYQRQSYNGSYARYLQQRFTTTFTGKMNITVREITSEQTRVRVNARYILASTGGNTWSFDSGSSATISVSNATRGIGANRTCRPTYAAEKAILGAIDELSQ
jgi:hypothetical protein